MITAVFIGFGRLVTGGLVTLLTVCVASFVGNVVGSWLVMTFGNAVGLRVGFVAVLWGIVIVVASYGLFVGVAGSLLVTDSVFASFTRTVVETNPVVFKESPFLAPFFSAKCQTPSISQA